MTWMGRERASRPSLNRQAPLCCHIPVHSRNLIHYSLLVRNRAALSVKAQGVDGMPVLERRRTLSKQLQHALRLDVGLGQHRRRGLNQNLVLDEVGRLERHI